MDKEQNKDIEDELADTGGADTGATEAGTAAEPQSRFPDLDELQQQVAKRIKSNRKFLDTYLSEEIDIGTNDLDSLDIDESEDDGEGSSDDETFEEL